MKKTGLLMLLFMSFLLAPKTYVFGQSVKQLDERYGFKSLKLGTTPNLSISKKIDSWDRNANISKYTYTGNDMGSIYNVPIKEVDLTYYKNRLMSIHISFNDGFSVSDYDLILYSLKQVFGEGNNCNVKDPDFSLSSCRKWVGAKVEMEILRLYYQKNNKWIGYLLIVEKSIQQQRISDEF